QLRKDLKPCRGDLYHEPNHIPLRCNLPTVVTLHDLSVLLHPEWHPADRIRHFQRHFQQGLTRSDHFLAVSEFTRQEIIRHLGIPAERVTRAYNGVRPGMRRLTDTELRGVLDRLRLSAGKYLLYVGTLEPRKNLETLV